LNTASATGGADRDREDDAEVVAALLGRRPLGAFLVVCRRPNGAPLVIQNDPFLFDGTPMPTRFWLVDPALKEAVSRMEAAGGVRRAEAEVDPAALSDAHARYAAQRDAVIDPAQPGPWPSGGVGGTRTGVKCLHAHLAWWLAGGSDPVGEWVAGRLSADLDGLELSREVLGESHGPGAP